MKRIISLTIFSICCFVSLETHASSPAGTIGKWLKKNGDEIATGCARATARGSEDFGRLPSFERKLSNSFESNSRPVQHQLPNSIEGVSPTKHSVHRKISREIKTSDELDALKKPLKINDIKPDEKGRLSQRYTGENASVVINPTDGKMASVNPTSTKLKNKLLNQKK